MAEIRIHPFTKEECIVFPEANQKPLFFDLENASNSVDNKSKCPFEIDREEMQERHIMYAPPGTSFENASAWVVYNKFPLFGEQYRETSLPSEELFQVLPAEGRAFVVVSRDHDTPFGMLPEATIYETLQLQLRLITYVREYFPGLQNIQQMRNVGKKAGASVVHPHSQLICTPFVPPRIRTYVQAFADHGSSCLMCRILQEEQSSRLRIVYENSEFVCIAPFASTTRSQVWIVPKLHQADFHEQSLAQQQALAECISKISKAYYRVYGALDYNEYVMTRPQRNTGMFHWFFVMHPRFLLGAGYELACGVLGTDLEPEKVAEMLQIS